MTIARWTLLVLLTLTGLLHTSRGSRPSPTRRGMMAGLQLTMGPVVYVRLDRPEFTIGDVAHGLLLLVAALIVRSSRHRRHSTTPPGS